MDLTTHQNNKLGQKQILNPEMLHSLKVLQLSKQELIEHIEHELEGNPALETIEEPSMEDSEDDIIDSKNDLDPSESSPEIRSDGDDEEEESKSDAGIPFKVSLIDYLVNQLRLTDLTQEEIRIGIVIAGSLNEDGYLKASVEEIADICGCSTNLEKVEKVLSLMQSFYPPGLCARDLNECLLIQVKQLELESPIPYSPIMPRIILHHLNALKRKDYKAIGRLLKTSPEEVASAAKIISSLDPTPGRKFCRYYPDYIYPDLFLYKFENQFEIRSNDDGMPKLKLSSLYRTNGKNINHLSEEDKEFIRQKKQSAELLVKNIHQRRRTLSRVMESILKFQREFFENGTKGLKPLQMRTVAEDIGLSESTVARATKNKYVHTPIGVFRLRDFFKKAIEQTEGQPVSSPVVQELIKKIVSEENPKKPYSDAKVEKLVKAAGFEISRRTIAKYREKIGILPSNLRKKP